MFDKSTKVSVIIPNYNSQKTIELCLDALTKQTHKPFETIVVDDGSSDQSLSIIQKFDCNLIRTKKNSGPSKARNMGAALAKGEVLFFLDSDVALYPNAIENALYEFNNDNRLGSVCGIYDKEPLIRDNLVEDYRSLQAYYWRKSTEGIVTPGFFSLGAVLADVFREVGDFNELLRDSEDAEYGHRLSENYKLLLTSNVMGKHDDDDDLFNMMSKLFRRARTRVPLYFKRKKPMSGFETINRSLALAFAFAFFVSLPFGLLSPILLTVPVILLLIFVALDFGQYCFVLKEKGLPFLVYFIFIHIFVSGFAGLGVIKGIWDCLFDKKFREGIISN